MSINPRAAQRTTELINRLNKPKTSPLDDRKRVIIAHLRVHGRTYRDDLFKLFNGCSHAVVDSAVSHLFAEGVVERIRPGLYDLTEHGHSLCDG